MRCRAMYWYIASTFSTNQSLYPRHCSYLGSRRFFFVSSRLLPLNSHSLGTIGRLLYQLNRVFCRVMYKVTPQVQLPLPEEGPALVVADHTSLSDPLVLSATAGRHITFVMAREIYLRPHLRWVFRAGNFIPVQRGIPDVAAVRAMLRVLQEGEVLGLFPEGGIDEYRDEQGYLGVGYLALKTGVPVVPASIAWDTVRPQTLLGSLLTPGRAIVRYGTPILFQPDPDPSRDQIVAATATIMQAIRSLRMLQG